MTTALQFAGRYRALTLTWGRERAPVAAERLAAIPASLADMGLTPHERARKANAALTTEQRQAAGRARAATLHHPITLARRIAKAWGGLSDEDRREVRRALREAGVIK